MTQTAKQVSDAVFDILKDCRIEGNILYLPAKQLDRKLYEQVNDALTRMGGKWNRSKKGHIFPVDPTRALTAILNTGEAPVKNPMDFFATPEALADRMAARIPYWAETILEPSAGTGAIALSARKYCDKRLRENNVKIECCEIIPEFQEHLRRLGFPVVASDFLNYDAPRKYSCILMNPPFTSPDDPLAYIAHIEHALQVLARGGDLIAIAPGGFAFRNDKRIVNLRNLVEKHGSWEQLEDETFKESGTGVRTVLIEMRKP